MQSSGIGLFSILFVVFLVLKLVGVIDWSWLWVLSPLWIPFSLVIAGLLIWFVCVLIAGQIDRYKANRIWCGFDHGISCAYPYTNAAQGRRR